jgi:hypothetical protein
MRVAGFEFYNGIYKMQVGMDKFLILLTLRAYTATISFSPIRTRDILRVSNSQREFAAAFRSQEKLRVTDSVFLNSLYQKVFGARVSLYVFKLHG